jgi:hypothetical protein
LNCSGPRVESRKGQGLFRKKTRAKRYLLFWAIGSRSGGSRRRGTRDLILGIHLGSGGWDPTRVLGRRRSPAGGSVRGGAARGLPEMADPALQGLVWPGIWPRSTSTAWVNHWGTQRGGAGLGEGFSPTRAAWRGRGSPAPGVCAVPVLGSECKRSSARARF